MWITKYHSEYYAFQKNLICKKNIMGIKVCVFHIFDGHQGENGVNNIHYGSSHVTFLFMCRNELWDAAVTPISISLECLLV